MLPKSVYELHPKRIGSLGKLGNEWKRHCDDNPGEWIFRGQGSKTPEFHFQTSLERAIQRFGKTDINGDLASILHKGVGDNEGKPFNVEAIEEGIIGKFQRHAHHYLTWVPEEDNTMEWLALMQHYGAPTRLHDWTHSLYIAAFFAVENLEEHCAVWALNVDCLERKLKDEIGELRFQEIKRNDRNWRKPEDFDEVFRGGRSIVCHVNPFRLNERLAVQQGVFLCPGDISKTFEDNLADSLRGTKNNPQLIKFRITDLLPQRKEILRDLHRMNMNRTTLFPGLQGFAESLKTLLVFPEMLVPGRDRERTSGTTATSDA